MPQRIALIGEAVQACLVHTHCIHVLPRVGLHASLDDMRPSLQNRLEGVDLSPRPPTDTAMNIMTGRRQRDPGLLTRLVVSQAHLIAARPLTTLPPGAPQLPAISPDDMRPRTRTEPPAEIEPADPVPLWSHTAHLPMNRRAILARGVRLPKALNVTMEASAPERVGRAAGIRSQTRSGAASTSAWDVSGPSDS